MEVSHCTRAGHTLHSYQGTLSIYRHNILFIDAVCDYIIYSIYRHSVGVSAISSLCWDSLATVSTHPLLFSSSSGHIGALPRHWVHTEGEREEGERVKEKNNNVVPQDNEPISENDDQLFDDSLLLEVMCIYRLYCVY